MNKKYRVLIGAFMIQAIIIGSMFSYGVFFSHLEQDLGWSRTLLSACMSVALFVMGSFGILAGRLNDHYGPGGVITAAAFTTGLGYVLMYFLSAPWQIFLLFGGFVGLGMAAHDVVTLSTIARTFPRRRGIMTAIVKVGTACGQILIPVLAAYLILRFEWRPAFVVLGVGAFGLLLIAARLIATPIGASTTSDSATPLSGLSFSEARRGRILWTLCLIQFCFFPTLLSIPVHIVPHALDLGQEATRAAWILSIIGGASIAGRPSIGLLADRIGPRNAFVLCFIPLVASLLWLQVIHNPDMLFAFALVYGFGHGGLFTVVSPTIAEYFGMLAHGTLFGMVLFFGTIGGSLGPTLAGLAFDHTGSYKLAFTVLVALMIAAMLLTLSLPRSRGGDS